MSTSSPARFGAPFLFGLLLGSVVLASPQEDVVGPGKAAVDAFHPGGLTTKAPLYGGRVIVHISTLPKHMNYVTENSGTTRRVGYEVHSNLLLEDWEFHDMRPELCHSYVVEDLIVLKTDQVDAYAAARTVRVKNHSVVEGASEHVTVKGLFGKVTEEGESYRIEPLSKGHPLSEAILVPKAHVERFEGGAVMSFDLRDDVRWHPVGDAPADQLLDAADVHFSWSVYKNPTVDCDEKRFLFNKVTECEVVDSHYVRFFYEEQYAFALATVGSSLTILPRHVYDLSDPDNPNFKKRFTQAEQGEFINDNPHNRMWIGLGPYRITEWNDQYVEAERFTDADGKALYFDKERSGYMDTIRWRLIADDAVAINALLNGELDYFERIKPEDYFGGQTDTDVFKDSYYKGYKYLGIYGYTGWNLFRPQLKEKAVRDAIELATDMPTYLETFYKGLARRTTGPFPYNSAAYDHSVEAHPFDPDAAMDLLDDAGWYDRNGDGTRDKNGVELVISFLYPSGNASSKGFGLMLQESLADIEVRLNLEQLEWATFLDRIKKRDFDACNLAWIPELESDPEQLWHSKWGAADVESSNHSGVMDPVLDEMIARGQRELDKEKRQLIWNEMHRHVYEKINPYLFMWNVPQKFGISKRIHGVQLVAIDPGYVLRRWYFVDPAEPGTRKTLDR